MELGTIQKAWLKELREHPEKQMKERLGDIDTNTDELICGCCLGQLVVCYNKAMGKKNITAKLPDKDINMVNQLVTTDGDFESNILPRNFGELGLKGVAGKIDKEVVANGTTYGALAELNDHLYTWPQIADFVEQNPENVFTKSI